jgi:hypothetical protein
VPVRYRIDPAVGLVRTRCEGYVTLPDVLAHFHDLAADPDCPPRLDVLLDLRFITLIPRIDELQAVGAEIARVRPAVEFGACAIVGERDEVFATAKVFEVVAARTFRSSHVFRTIAEAEDWLTSQRQRPRPV